VKNHIIFLAVSVVIVLTGTTACLSLEKRQGIVRMNQTIQCLNQCDYYFLEPDTLYAFIYLKPDALTSISLFQYRDVHVEVTGYQASCGGCLDLIVTDVRILPVITGITVVDGAFPAMTMLERNYPNPFNPTTAIRYDLHTRSEVKIAIFNILGREITRLVSATQSPGHYDIVWNAADQPAGVYLCRFTALHEDGSVRSSVAKLMFVK